MQRRTTTLQIQKAMKSNYLHLIKAEVYNKSTGKTEVIPNDKFLEFFDFFCEAGIFMDAVGWHYERNHKTDNYEIECSRMDIHTATFNFIIICLMISLIMPANSIHKNSSFTEEIKKFKKFIVWDNFCFSCWFVINFCFYKV